MLRLVATAVIPAAELATIMHIGGHADYDRSYGALGAHVTRHALGVEGPMRESGGAVLQPKLGQVIERFVE